MVKCVLRHVLEVVFVIIKKGEIVKILNDLPRRFITH